MSGGGGLGGGRGERPSLRIVSPRFGPQILGGVEALLRRLALALAGRGWDVDVLTTTAVDEATWGGDLPASESDSGVRVRRFRPLLPRRPGAFRQATRAFFRLPPGLRPEPLWIRAQGPYVPALVGELARSRRSPLLFAPYLYHPSVAGLPAAARPRLLLPAAHDEPALRLAAVRRLVAACDGLWYSTPEERDLLETTHPEAAARPAELGTTAVETGRGEAARFRARSGVRGPFLLYSGRQTAGKGYPDALRALSLLRAEHPEAQLVVTGERPPPGDGVVGLGVLPEELWHDALAATTAVVVPGRLESLSLVCLEAWAEGRPCLVEAGSPVLRGQAERSGGAIAVAGPEEMARAAAALLDHPGTAARVGARGRAYVEAEHTWERVVAHLQALLAAARERLR